MNKTQAKQFLKDVANYGSQRKAAAVLGLARSTVGERVSKAREMLGETIANRILGSVPASGHKTVAAPTKTAIADAIVSGDRAAVDRQMLEDEVVRLRRLNKSLTKEALTDEKVRRGIFEIAHCKPTMPAWLLKAPAASDTLPGVPILFGSDFHWGEVVNPDEIGGVNKYNLEIAHQRLNRLIETTIELLTNHMVNPKYPGIIFALGGDMVSGDIHEELSETNEAPIMPVVLDLVDHLVMAITRLKGVFGRVFLPCVAGNHGRNTHKVRAKQFNHNSFDWLIYQCLDRHFADDPDVVFFIPDGTDALVSVCGHRYLFTHGNQFRGGDGMIGALGPIIRGDHKKRGRNAQVGQEYDTLVLGHWHQLVQMKRVIVNGSLIGYNEYAYSGNFGYEPPQQALWITHPRHGITFSMPVNVDADFGKKSVKGGSPWVEFHDAKKAA